MNHQQSKPAQQSQVLDYAFLSERVEACRIQKRHSIACRRTTQQVGDHTGKDQEKVKRGDWEGVGKGLRTEILLVSCIGGPLEEELQWRWSVDNL